TTASRLLPQRRFFLHLNLMCSFKLWIIISLMVLVLVASSFTVMAQKRKTTVDLIIRGGTVVTMDGERHVIENGAVAVKGGRIVSVGSAADIDRTYTAREIVNAAGKVIIPG